MSEARVPYVVDDRPPHLVPVPPHPLTIFAAGGRHGVPDAHGVAAGTVNAVRIGVGDRWVFVVRPPRPLARAAFAAFKAELDRWWASGEPFGVVGVTPETAITVQRVDT